MRAPPDTLVRAPVDHNSLDRRRPDRDPDDADSDERAGALSEMARSIARAVLLLGIVGAGIATVLWWSGSTVRFAAARAANGGQPTWKVHGTVVDDRTGQAIPWAHVEDDPAGAPPFFSADANGSGEFHLMTLPERHRVRVRALGYAPVLVSVGPTWFTWRPSGSEKVTVVMRRTD
jgi:hypothetical protein